MQFNNLQLAAVLKMGMCMANADGIVKDEENKLIAVGIGEFGVSPEHFLMLGALSESMTPATMIATLSALNDSQKKFVCGFLASIMSCDGDIDDAEVKLWQMTSMLAGFPTMTIAEACEYWRSH